MTRTLMGMGGGNIDAWPIVGRNTVVNMCPEGKVMVIETLGKFSKLQKSGLFFLVPIFQKIAYVVDMREKAMEIDPQPAITRDNVSLQVSGNVYLRFIDAKKAAYGSFNPQYAVVQNAQSAMRAIIGKMELDEILHARDTINSEVTKALDMNAEPWGLQVLRYEITQLTPNHEIQHAMDKQAVAERERREVVKNAEGMKEAAVLQSEGIKIKMTNESEGELIKIRNEAQADKERQILEAEGEAQSVLAKAEAQAKAIAMISAQLATAEGKDAAQLTVAKDYIEMYGAIGMSSNTMFFGGQAGDVSQLVAQAASVFKATVDGEQGHAAVAAGKK